MEETKLKRQQILLFVIMFCGYTLYVLTRQSLSFNIPNIKIHENVKSEEIGTLTSALALGYAVGKFLSGVMVDFASPKQLFSLGLCICGLINVSFSYITSMPTLVFLWLANGLFQGLGWPTCAKLLKRWYDPKHFGTLWSLLSASMNVAASIGPILSNIMMNAFGSWRYSMRIYGTVAVALALICLLLIQDSPKDDVVDKDVSNTDSQLPTQTTKMKAPTLAYAIGRIVKSPVEYIMSLGFLACLLCKGVMSDWIPIYLITEKHATREMTLSLITAFQVGGFTGNISSGAITDWITLKMGSMKKGHPRNFYLIPLIAILFIFVGVLCNYVEDVASQYTLVISTAFAIGFAVYSSISIVGVTVVEISASDISGTSHAVAALFGNVGLILSGLPFTLIAESFSWNAAFICMEGVVIAWLLLVLFSQFIEYEIGEIREKIE